MYIVGCKVHCRYRQQVVLESHGRGGLDHGVLPLYWTPTASVSHVHRGSIHASNSYVMPLARTTPGRASTQLKRSGQSCGLVGSAQHHQSSPRTIRKFRSWNGPDAISRSSWSWARISEGAHQRKGWVPSAADCLRACTTTSSCAIHAMPNQTEDNGDQLDQDSGHSMTRRRRRTVVMSWPINAMCHASSTTIRLISIICSTCRRVQG
jgi:hypothetical protein